MRFDMGSRLSSAERGPTNARAPCEWSFKQDEEVVAGAWSDPLCDNAHNE